MSRMPDYSKSREPMLRADPYRCINSRSSGIRARTIPTAANIKRSRTSGCTGMRAYAFRSNSAARALITAHPGRTHLSQQEKVPTTGEVWRLPRRRQGSTKEPVESMSRLDLSGSGGYMRRLHPLFHAPRVFDNQVGRTTLCVGFAGCCSSGARETEIG